MCIRDRLHKIRPYSAFVVCSLLVAAVSVAAQLYIPILCGDAIDKMLGKGNVDPVSYTHLAFYAHQKTRKNYYQIGVELANSGFEYFAGGEFQKVNGDGAGPDNHNGSTEGEDFRGGVVCLSI